MGEERRETSYGIIPVRFNDGHGEVLLVQHSHGHWSFPKGRMELGETPLQCAKRELLEETQLHVVHLLSERTFVEHYHFLRNGHPTEKSVTYYLAEVEGQPLPQAAELLAYRWCDLDTAGDLLTFPEARNLYSQAKVEIKKIL